MNRGWIHPRLGRMLAPSIVLLVLIAGCGGSRKMPTPREGAPGATSRLRMNFPLLRTPAYGVPREVWQSAHRSLRRMRWDQAHRIPVSSSEAYWLVPGDEVICVIALSRVPRSIGAVCAPIAQALRHGVAYTSLGPAPRKRMIVGVAPEGFRRVTVRSPKTSRSVGIQALGVFALRDDVMEGPELFILHQR